MRASTVIAGLLLCCTEPHLFAQLAPESAHVHVLFPQFADGGPPSLQVQTIFTFSNPNSAAASVTIYLLGNDGLALLMDFGSGPGNAFSFSIPAYGTITLQSRIASTSIVVGWADAYSSLPVNGVVSYRFLQYGAPLREVSIAGTLPTTNYFSSATSSLGIAVANIYSGSASFRVTARSNDGSVAQGTLTLPGRGHRSFTLAELIPILSSSFYGTIEIAGTDERYYFIATTLKTDGTVFSNLPSGNGARPIYQVDRINLVFARIREAARKYLPENVRLTISEEANVSAFGSRDGITINLALAELIADSESELAWVIGHELGHVYQFRTGSYRYNSSNAEWDADIWGLALSLSAGYDPYASAGALAKLAMATGQ